MYRKIALILMLLASVIIPVSAYTWTPISGLKVGSNAFLTFNGSSSLLVPGSITVTFNGVNSSGLYVGSLSGSCFGTLKEKNNASHLLLADITTSWSVNKTNAYDSSGSITYDISNIRSYNLSVVNNPVHNELQIGPVPSSCNIGAMNGFTTGISPSLGAYIALSGQLYAGEAGWALANIVDDAFGNGTAAYGTITTTVYATDGDAGNILVGATLNIKDVENSSWVNATSTALGIPVNTLATHTLDIYGSYPGVYNASQEIGAAPGGPYYLPLFRYSPASIGYVNLYITARDTATGLAIKNAPVSVKLPTGATTGSNTGASGTASFTVPNNTVVIYSASPSGYTALSLSTTMGIVDKHVYIDLTRSTVPTSTTTPVVTNPATGAVITAQPTYLQYCNPAASDYNAASCSRSQDNDLMATLREWAPTLLILAILAWMMGLLKMMGK